MKHFLVPTTNQSIYKHNFSHWRDVAVLPQPSQQRCDNMRHAGWLRCWANIEVADNKRSATDTVIGLWHSTERTLPDLTCIQYSTCKQHQTNWKGSNQHPFDFDALIKVGKSALKLIW